MEGIVQLENMYSWCIMNDKDKEEYDKWLEVQNWHYDSFDNEYYQNGLKISIYGETEEAWQSACEYKQKEIILLENQISWLEEQIDDFMDEPDIVIKKLQAEKAELIGQLKSCIFVYEEKVNRLLKELKDNKGT